MFALFFQFLLLATLPDYYQAPTYYLDLVPGADVPAKFTELCSRLAGQCACIRRLIGAL
jgi:hypothetical protein